ncbi:MAG: (d)CMP kinase [Bacteroidaceae bacterium]|nr:(d)CMP kinase [Bacteroidaceae bacterium]
MKDIIIAIDGHSSCGKSTMAKVLASRIGYTYVDTGAMYRAVTYFCMKNNLIQGGDIDIPALEKALPDADITFRHISGSQKTYLDGEDIEEQIRSMEVSSMVSPVAAIPFVRTAMVERQRRMGEMKRIVMDGRDIGTTVFPNAEMKVFVTASAEIRAERRFIELTEKGLKVDYNDILANVRERDHIDSTRSVSPLRKADDAIVLDNSQMTRQEQNEWLYNHYLEIAGR